jgi:hypothetical protein
VVEGDLVPFEQLAGRFRTAAMRLPPIVLVLASFFIRDDQNPRTMRRGTRWKPRRREGEVPPEHGLPRSPRLGRHPEYIVLASVFAHGRSSPARHLSAERRSFGAWRDHVAGKGNAGSPVRSRVEIWRGGGRFSLNCCRPFRLSVSEYLTMSRFPDPAHQTGRADFLHPAFGQGAQRSRTR